MFKPTVVVVFYLLARVDCCDFEKREKRTHCDSFEDLRKAGLQLGWEKLNMVGTGGYVVVGKDEFVNTPNVIDLQIKSISNLIKQGALNGLDKLYELHLDLNQLNKISARTFENPSLEVIYIFDCNVEDIQPRAFEGIPKLRNILITGNSIPIIRKGVFNNLTVVNVYLRRNKIQYVEREAFFFMPNLKFLSLEENELRTFDSTIVIGQNPSLERLYINRNELSEVKRDMFSMIPNLIILLMNINRIENLGMKAFVDLKKLHTLDISRNMIDEIRPDVFPREGNSIAKLFLHDNRLTFITTEALLRLPHLKQISATGNPWQCPCQERFQEWLRRQNIARICDQEFVKGQRPNCVVHANTKECIYDKEKNKDIVKYYEKIIKEYPPLPPVCETDNKEVPQLGAK